MSRIIDWHITGFRPASSMLSAKRAQDSAHQPERETRASLYGGVLPPLTLATVSPR